ncbi:TPA: AlpA family phage regulatory protein [Stenotrophomonas maltophilia]|nr:AlpA family phage regulatory protein [Stenotrophomonas maltophilia]
MEKASSNPLRVVRREEVQRRLGISRSTIYEYLNRRSPSYRPSFPRPVHQGRTMGFIEQEVDDYVRCLMDARRLEL